jgi:hypothetical protein
MVKFLNLLETTAPADILSDSASLSSSRKVSVRQNQHIFVQLPFPQPNPTAITQTYATEPKSAPPSLCNPTQQQLLKHTYETVPKSPQLNPIATFQIYETEPISA